MEHNAETGDLFDFTDLDEKLTEAHYNRAVGYLKIGQLELAAQASMDALEINPDYAPVHALLEPLKSEQAGFYPSYGWYEEYDMLDELEGSEHY